MNSIPNTNAVPSSPAHGDRLADSVLLLLVMTLVQRLMGFFRGVLFCRWLEPAELGQWDIALGFLELAAPLAVLGIPGSFGRYVEYYCARGQLRTFLQRTIALTAVLAVLAVAAVALASDWFARVFFGTAADGPFVLLLAGGLAVIIVYNFITTLLTALRRSRVVSLLEFGSSLVFAVASIALLGVWRNEASSVVIGYGIAMLLASIAGAACLRQASGAVEQAEQSLTHRALWGKLLPFAIWVWATNWLANLFELADRYMIVQFSGLEPAQALAAVGNYHSSRVVPLLLVSVTSLLGTMLTPYFSHDWESGGPRAVSARLNLTLKLLALVLLSGAVAILLLAPTLFSLGFKGKYADGLAVLPWTLTYCIWFGIARVAQKYMWCAERVRLAAGAWLLGLLVNVGLNVILLPRYGLTGVVLATAAGNLVSLFSMYAINRWLGMHLPWSTCLLSLAPLVLTCGPLPAVGLLALLLVGVLMTDYLFTTAEKHQLQTVLHYYLARFRGFTQRANRTLLEEAS